MAPLEIKTYKIQTDKLKKSDRPVRMALLADLHDQLWGEGQEKLLRAIDRLSVDMVLCAGDMVLSKKQRGMEHALLLFRRLRERNLPVYACNGNHESRLRESVEGRKKEYLYYVDKLHKMGVHLLINESTFVQVRNTPLQIHGYEMPMEYYHKFCRLSYGTKDLYHKLGRPRPEIFHILLAHNPVYFRTYARWGADLTVSGHLHGGLIRIPGIGGLITPQVKLFPKYDRGLYQIDGRYLAVSPGLGGHTVPIRIFNPPQLFGITIEGTGENGTICKN